MKAAGISKKAHWRHIDGRHKYLWIYTSDVKMPKARTIFLLYALRRAVKKRRFLSTTDFFSNCHVHVVVTATTHTIKSHIRRTPHLNFPACVSRLSRSTGVPRSGSLKVREPSLLVLVRTICTIPTPIQRHQQSQRPPGPARGETEAVIFYIWTSCPRI